MRGTVVGVHINGRRRAHERRRANRVQMKCRQRVGRQSRLLQIESCRFQRPHRILTFLHCARRPAEHRGDLLSRCVQLL